MKQTQAERDAEIAQGAYMALCTIIGQGIDDPDKVCDIVEGLINEQIALLRLEGRLSEGGNDELQTE